MRDPNRPCIFCAERGSTRRNALAYCARDSFPVTPGHSLVIPRRHCASFFDLSAEEIGACVALLLEERTALDAEFHPDGYNIGVNVGQAAGQSVLHVHIHVIPRYVGDHPRPQGGVRQIIPGKADYPRGSAPLASALPAGDPTDFGPSGVE